MSDIPTDAESSDDDKVVAAEREIALASFLPKRNLNKFYFMTLSNSFLIHNLAEKRCRRHTPNNEADLLANLGALIVKVVACDNTKQAPVQSSPPVNVLSPPVSFWFDYGTSLGKILSTMPSAVYMSIRHEIETVLYHETLQKPGQMPKEWSPLLS